MKRTHSKLIRLSENEYTALKNRAAKSGLSVESYIRSLLSNRIPKQLPPIEYHQMIEELRRIAEVLEDVKAYALIFNDENKSIYEENYKKVVDCILRIEKAMISPDVYTDNGSNKNLES